MTVIDNYLISELLCYEHGLEQVSSDLEIHMHLNLVPYQTLSSLGKGKKP